MRPLHYYLLGTGTWYASHGVQGVVFAWLVTMVLHQPGEMVGIAQMTLFLPGLLLMLAGGSVADRLGGQRVASWSQGVAALTPFILITALLTDSLTFEVMIIFAVTMGCAQAFVTPARDSLLNQVASGRIQRTVMLTSISQFGLQIIGFLVASTADMVGAEIILLAQSAALAVGAWAYRQIPTPAKPQPLQGAASGMWAEISEGARTVLTNPSMRPVVIQNVAMGLFFMGSFIVTMPLLVRDVFAGSSADLGFLNAANSTGLVVTVLVLLRLGFIARSGRALLLSQLFGAVALVLAARTGTFAMLLVAISCWGACGGVAMTMARTIMQEQAPPAQRARVMAFFSFSFMGAGPLGALLCGFMSARLGPQMALAIAGGAMFTVVTLAATFSNLWQVLSVHGEDETADDAATGSPERADSGVAAATQSASADSASAEIVTARTGGG